MRLRAVGPMLCQDADAVVRWRVPRERAVAEFADLDVMLEEVASARWSPACRHVGRGGILPVLCPDHVGLGFLCQSCSGRHLHLHVPDEEGRTCGRCGTVAEAGVPVAWEAEAVAMPVRSGSRTSVYSGPVLIAGRGMCPACLAAMTADV